MKKIFIVLFTCFILLGCSGNKIEYVSKVDVDKIALENCQKNGGIPSRTYWTQTIVCDYNK